MDTKNTYREQQKSCNVTGAQRGRTILGKNPAKLVGWDYPSAPRLRRKAGKKREQANHHQQNMQEKKSTYDDPWRRLMIMTKSRLSRKSCNPYKKNTRNKRELLTLTTRNKSSSIYHSEPSDQSREPSSDRPEGNLEMGGSDHL